MSKLLGRMFAHPPTEPDGLSQPQREAIVDLLNFCMCADDKLLLVEDKFITAEVARFTWEGRQSFESYAAASIERVGTALESFSNRAAFLAGIAERLATSEVKTQAIALCQKIFYADREYPDAEQVVFREIRHVFGWPVARPAATD